MRSIISVSLVVMLFIIGCQNRLQNNMIGTYSVEYKYNNHSYGREVLILSANGSYIQIFDDNTLKQTNYGTWDIMNTSKGPSYLHLNNYKEYFNIFTNSIDKSPNPLSCYFPISERRGKVRISRDEDSGIFFTK